VTLTDRHDKTRVSPDGSGDQLRFIEHLVQSKRIESSAIRRADHVAGEGGERLELVLTRLGLISEREFADALAEFLKVPVVRPDDYPAIPVLKDRLSARFLRDTRIIPLAAAEGRLRVAMTNPLDAYACQALRFAAGMPVEIAVACLSDFDSVFLRLYGESQRDAGPGEVNQGRSNALVDDVDRLKDMASDAPVIRLVNQPITRAVEMRASDIHIEPMENELCVRYRIDGVLQRIESPQQELASAIVSRIKIMARLNIAERRLSQDGRISMAVRGHDIDFRVSTTPTVQGESVVLRILDRNQLNLDFGVLGFEPDLIARFRQLTAQPHGIVLVTGPTGSGKTTTLYTALLELNTTERKILTIEDPVEYLLSGINQVQVKPQIGLTFANALRALLRQDPDIMMVGEIRDLETAQIAVQAALTGHLILSTLHTNDAPGAITRLIDMGLEDYLLTSTINGIAAQRLVRTLCEHCREPCVASGEMVERLSLHTLTDESQPQLFRPVGCGMCRMTGFHGRSSILEILVMTDTLRQAILKSANAGTLRELAISEGMEPMQVHGFRKALAGTTTVDEVLRVTHEGA